MEPLAQLVRVVVAVGAALARHDHAGGGHAGEPGKADPASRESARARRLRPVTELSLDDAVGTAATGDIWLFRGGSLADRAIRAATNAPINHVGMAVAIDDLPPLLWHAELGRSLPDVWTGKRQRGVQLHLLADAVRTWNERYGQRAWVRQLEGGDRAREHEDRLMEVIDRFDGRPFPTTFGLGRHWLNGRVRRSTSLETVYCAELVAITYQQMGLLPGPPAGELVRPGALLERRPDRAHAAVHARRRDRCDLSARRARCETLRMDLELLEQTLAGRGEPRFRAGQVWEWAARGAGSYDDMTNLPAGLRERAAGRGARSPRSSWSARRWLATAPRRRSSAPRDGRPVEAVLMRYRDGRRSLCLSSQSGCPLTCTFCATGAMKFGRNLTASEILDQALHFRRKEPVNHAVFMGMGEPLMNLDAVLAACERLPDVGITPRRTAISTVGWIPGIERLAERGAAGAARAVAARRRRGAALGADAGERALPAVRRARGLPALARGAPPAACSSST